MKELRKLLPKFYRSFRLSTMIDSDLKEMRKINLIFKKYERSSNDIFMLEAQNFLKKINNIIQLDKIFDILEELVEEKYLDYFWKLKDSWKRSVIMENTEKQIIKTDEVGMLDDGDMVEIVEGGDHFKVKKPKKEEKNILKG